MIVNIGKNIELDIDIEALPANAMEHVVRIGLRNILMDSHAGVNAKAMPELSAEQVVEQSRAVAEKKLAALMAGEVRVAGTRAAKASADPVEAEAVRLAWDAVKLAFRTKGKDVPKDKVTKAWLVAAFLGKYPRTMDTARANVEAAKEAAGAVDLDDLGI